MTIHQGDCLDVMATMPEASIDAIVCDPPYGLEFMGKEWDRIGHQGQVGHAGPSEQDDSNPFTRSRISFYGSQNRKCRTCGHWQWSGSPCKCETPDFPVREHHQGQLMQQWHEQWATAALRVAKPGAYLLAFGGTRTVHRMTVALEDAGWIIRDVLCWVYASGFPKSKSSLKPAWEPIVLARKPGPLQPLGIDAARIGTEPWSRKDGDAGAGFSTGKFMGSMGLGEPTMTNGYRESAAGRWPANVVLTDEVWGEYSRFYLVAKASRSDREPVMPGLLEERHAGVAIRAAEPGTYQGFVHPAPDGYGEWLRDQRKAAGLSSRQVAEHFPSRTGGLTGCVANWEGELNRPTPEQWRTLRQVIGFDDRYDEVMTTTMTVERADMGDGSGIAGVPRDPNDTRRRLPSRRANVHPTVKPIELMRHLVRLVTPPGGTVLDPFAGSGSTLLAAEQEGFRWVGIEREAEYVRIIEARLQGTQRGLGLSA